MKTLICYLTIFLTSINLFSQDLNVSLKDNKLQGKVIKVEEYTYRYDSNMDGYYIESISENNYNKSGNMTTNIYQYFGSYYQSKSTTTYSYNNNKLIGDATEVISLLDNKTTNTSTNYIYTNNLLTKKEYISEYPSIIEYSYDSKGNLLQAISKNNTGETTAIYDYLNYKNSDSYTKIYKYFYKGSQESTSTYLYENGNNISYSFLGKNSSSFYKYTYDSYGNTLETIMNDNVLSSYNYEYSSDGNWLKKRYAYKSTYEDKTYNVFSFRKITYANGKTVGNTNFDIPFIKKYEQKNEYVLKALEKKEIFNPLEDPEKVDKIYVLKTEGEKFKVKTDKDVYLTSKVSAVKHTNLVDMIVYHPKSNTTAIARNFSDNLTRQEMWMEATIISNTHNMFWCVNENKNWYITDKGTAFKDYNLYTVKYSTTNPNDVIMYKDNIATYIMRDFKNAIAHKLYTLEKI